MGDLVLHGVLCSCMYPGREFPRDETRGRGSSTEDCSSWPFRENKCETSVAQVPSTYLRKENKKFPSTNLHWNSQQSGTMLNEKFNLIFTFHRPNDALSISDIIEKTWSKSLIAAKESRGKGIGRINTNGRWRSVAPVPCVQRKRPAPESIVKSGAGGGGSASSNDSVHSS